MKVLIDTCIWSLALRRDIPSDQTHHVLELRQLISDFRVQMIGPVRQELLSGIRDRAQFDRLREHLRAFPDLALKTEDYERAAEFYNTLRARGIQGSNTDFLICAAADRHDLPIYTVDTDFLLFAQHLPIQLYRIQQSRDE
jgi:predicted nucleic acid-binding protein